MKKFSLVFAVSFLFLTGIMAQTKSERAVAAAAEKLKMAMISGNQQDLEAVVMDELSYGHSSGMLDDKKLFIDKLVSGKSDFVEIDITDQSVQVINKTGIVRHTLSARTNDNNKAGTVTLKILLVFVKDHGQWKLLARQAVKPA